MPLAYRKVADVLEGLALSREQFASIHHVDEEPRRHIDYLRVRRSEFYEQGRNEQTALRVVLLAVLVADHGFSKDEACAYAREAMPVSR
jgi:hypothetical protein